MSAVLILLDNNVLQVSFTFYILLTPANIFLQKGN